MFESNGQDRQYTTRSPVCESNSDHSIVENKISEDSDNANPRRVMIVTAAAGALTAAMILAGWGIHIERNEAGLLRAGLSVSADNQGSRFSFFHALDMDNHKVITQSPLPSMKVNQDNETQEGKSLTEKTINIEQLKLRNERLRKYARKRTKLQRIITRLRSYESKRKEEITNPETESAVTGAQLTENAEYRTLLREAAKLRDELEQLHNESLSNISYANRSLYRDQSISSRSKAQSRETTGLANENNVPYKIITVNNHTATKTPIVQSHKPEWHKMSNMKRVYFHTHQLITRLEKTRLVVTTRLAAVTWSDNQPVH